MASGSGGDLASANGGSSSVVAVENSSPEVIHVVAPGSEPNYSANPRIQTITISTGNLTFPVTLSNAPVVHVSQLRIDN